MMNPLAVLAEEEMLEVVEMGRHQAMALVVRPKLIPSQTPHLTLLQAHSHRPPSRTHQLSQARLLAA
jgi:hypothetical protein